MLHCKDFILTTHKEQYIHNFCNDRFNTNHNPCRRGYLYNNPQSS